MNYLPEARLNGLAERYVLGVMPRRSRRRFSRLLTEEPAAWAAVLSVEAKLRPLIDGLDIEVPPARVWDRIDAYLDSSASIPGGQRLSTGWLWLLIGFFLVTSVISAAGWWLTSASA